MKYLVISILICLFSYGEGGALPCPPGMDVGDCAELQLKALPCQLGDNDSDCLEKQLRALPCRPGASEGECLEMHLKALPCRPGGNEGECLEMQLRALKDDSYYKKRLANKNEGSTQQDDSRNDKVDYANLNDDDENVTPDTLRSEDNILTADSDKIDDLNVNHIDDDAVDTIDEMGKDAIDKGHILIKRSVCKAHQEFQSECNSCQCAADGQSYTCTHNECMEGDTNKEVEVFMENEGADHVEKHSVCKPRDTFYINCNICHCNPYGTDYSCTNKACPLPEDVEIFHELKATKLSEKGTQKIVCVANRMFIKDCNTCWCNEDGTGFFCTRKVCVPELPEDGAVVEEKPEELRIIMKECRPDEVFELDCNMCRCNSDGKSFSCTRRACVEPFDEEDMKKNLTVKRQKREENNKEGLRQCLPGQEFRRDCNTCLCDNEGQSYSCTRNDCQANNNRLQSASRDKRETPQAQQVKTECVPDSVYDIDCNVCRCEKDGKHAMCTTQACHTINESNDPISPLPELDPTFRCNPGEQFKRGCNDCSCSADGKSVFCTVRYCDQDITPPTNML